MMKREVFVSILLASHLLLVTIVPGKPSIYCLTIDILAGLLSWTACISIQSFLISQPLRSILNSLLLLLILMEEIFITRMLVISLIGNLLPENLLWFYQEYAALAKYILNLRPVATLQATTLQAISTARIILFLSPATYQNMNKAIFVNCSIILVIALNILDLVINDVRCLAKYGEEYEAEGTLLISTEIVFLNNSQFNHISAANSTLVDHNKVRCFDIPLPTLFTFLTVLTEGLRIMFVVYTALKPKNSAEGSSQPQFQMTETSTLQRSRSFCYLTVKNLRERSSSLMPSEEVWLPIEQTSRFTSAKQTLLYYFRKVAKSLKDLLVRSSTVALVMSALFTVVLLSMFAKFHQNHESGFQSNLEIVIILVRIWVFIVPPAFCLLDPDIYKYTKTKFSQMIPHF